MKFLPMRFKPAVSSLCARAVASGLRARSTQSGHCKGRYPRLTLKRAAWWAISTLLFTMSAYCQPSQFLFDANGNLTAQLAGSVFPPQIIGQPQNQVVATNESAAFSVVVADPRSMTFQWRLNNSNLGGATNAALLLANVSTNNEGQYRVVLTNPSGSVTSAPAMLWIDNDGDGLGDSWESTHFGNLTRNATSDFDGDGLSNLREFLDGSDPTDSNSARYRLLVIREGGTVIKSPDQTSYNKGQSVMLTVTASPNELFHAWLGDVVTRDNPVTLVMTNDKTVYARFTPISFLWTNVVSGNWETSTNWSPNLVPGLDDSVIINSNVTVTLNTPAFCADVSLGSFATILTGSGALTVRGNLFWTAGTMSGSGRTILESNAILNIQSDVVLNTRTLENRGTILWSGSNLGVLGGAVITNRPGGLFQAESPSAAVLGGGIANGRFDNAGDFRKVVGSGPLTLSSGLRFNNSGTVTIEANLLLCGDGFTNNGGVILSPGTTNRFTAGGSGNGTFFTPTTALVDWTGGTFTLNSGAQLNGVGLYRIGNPAVVTANANFTVTNLDLIAGGTLGGSGTVTIGNSMNWTGGTMSGSGRTIIPPGITLNATISSSAGLNGRTLENSGTVLWTGVGNIGFVSAVITNRAGALFHAQGGGGLSFVSGPNRFDNAGTFRKSVHTGSLDILDFSSSSSFNNFGTVEIQTGTLLCNAGFTNIGTVQLSNATTNRLAGGGSATGTFDTPATALVEWTGRTFTLNPGAQLNGTGLYRINGISTAVAGNGDVTVQNFDLVNGSSTLSGTGILTIANVMNWTAGTMSGSGRTIIPSGATLKVGSSSGVSLQRTLENGGNAVWSGSGSFIMLNGVVTNRAGALFHAQNASQFFFAGGGCRFDNAGTFRKSANTGTTTLPSGVPFNNSGTVDIRSGILAANGGYVSSSNALLNCALGGTTAGTNYGQLQVSGAVALNGRLSVDLINGFIPVVNDSFTVLTAGTRNGTFANFYYPSNAVTMQMSNTVNSVIVRATEILVVPPPILLQPELSATDIRLIWTATSNTAYRLEYKTDLGLTNWTGLAGDVTSPGNTASKLDALTSSNRFYRVRVVP
jgi:hypothetical protein